VSFNVIQVTLNHISALSFIWKLDVLRNDLRLQFQVAFRNSIHCWLTQCLKNSLAISPISASCFRRNNDKFYSLFIITMFETLYQLALSKHFVSSKLWHKWMWAETRVLTDHDELLFQSTQNLVHLMNCLYNEEMAVENIWEIYVSYKNTIYWMRC